MFRQLIVSFPVSAVLIMCGAGLVMVMAMAVLPAVEPAGAQDVPESRAPGAGTAGSETPDSETSAPEQPASASPDPETEDSETPGSETRGSELPASESPDHETGKAHNSDSIEAAPAFSDEQEAVPRSFSDGANELPKEERKERLRRLAIAGLLALGLVCIVFLVLILLVALWAHRIRSMTRQPLPEAPSPDPLFYLRQSGRPGSSNRPVPDDENENASGA